jgi:hypothetical protein
MRFKMTSGLTVFLLIMISANMAFPAELDEELALKVIEEAEAEIDRMTLENAVSVK